MINWTGPGWTPAPLRALRPIVRPGTPQRAASLLAATGSGLPLNLGVLLGLLAATVPGIALALAGADAVGVVLMFAPFVAAVAFTARYRHHVVSGPRWQYEGVSLNDATLDLLEDIQGRFDFAHRLVDEVPTGIDWSEVASHVDVLMWESAGHAARVSALDAEVHGLRYAASGTPQYVLLEKLVERRKEHWAMLVDAQREADSLAREAGNAAAAAKVALAKTGSLRALEIVAPSPKALVAKGALSEARARLKILADVWAELDESGELLAQRLELDE